MQQFDFAINFDEEERYILNQFGKEFVREKFIEQLKIIIVCAVDEMKSVAESLLKKIEKMSDREWSELQMFILLDVSI